MPTSKHPHNGQNLPLKIENESTTCAYLTHPSQRAKISMIATPIGNLSDISPRVEQMLMSVDEIWCEDTRHTQTLLHALSIEKKRLRRVDQHTSDSELRHLLEQVEQGNQQIGVVTDAGTPGLSDPGAKIAELIFEFPNIRLEPVAGPSALSTFISVAGLSGNSLSFQGFFPRTERDALTLLSQWTASQTTPNLVFFESPNRIRAALSVLEKWSLALSYSPRFVLAKELTKMHETLFMGKGSQYLSQLLGQGFDERGEWVIGITLPKDYLEIKKDESEWQLTLECLIESGVSTKDSAQIIASKFSVAKNLAYQNAIEYQKKIKK